MTTFDTFVPLTPNSSPSSVAETVRPRIIANDYGGAYTQRRPDGINSTLVTMKLVFANITMTEARDMMNFFAGKRGTTPFWYDAVGDGNPKKWIATEWSYDPRGVNDNDVTVSLQEIMDP